MMSLPGKMIRDFVLCRLRSSVSSVGVMATITAEMWAVWPLILNGVCTDLIVGWHRDPVAWSKSLFEEEVLGGPAAMIPMFETFKYLAQLVYVHMQTFSPKLNPHLCVLGF